MTSILDREKAASIVEQGRNVILQEAQALVRLGEHIGQSFHDAVNQILETKGRIVVTGIGKSGLVGRKIAATLSATGSPAFFVHAAEAGHGDLGMIKPGDTLFILSNSGAATELEAIVAYAEACSVPIIGVASKSRSPLIRRATVPIVIPDVAEACPKQMAPTTSTTMMLALGDALAIAAMGARGISRDDLIRLHPGGWLGFKHRPVDTVVREDDPLPLVREDTPMKDVVLVMTAAGKGLAGVIDAEGMLIGAVSDGDLRRSFDRVLQATAGDIMNRNPIKVQSGTAIGEAQALMIAKQITAVFVMDDIDPGRPKGLINIHDLGIPG